MLKRIMGVIRRELLKVDWVKRAVADYRLRAKKERHRQRLDLIVNSGQVRNIKPEKLDPFDTLVVVTDDGVMEEYMNGRVVGQGYVTRGDGGNSEEDSSASVCRDLSVFEPVEGVGAKGHTSWFCRYNCMRLAEKKLENAKIGRKITMKSKKPSKEKLEEHLRAGAHIADIARKYDASVQSVHNWIKSYSLAGIQGQKKPFSEKQTSAGDDFDIVADQVRRAKEIITKPILEEMVQESPTLAEIEQFHTDTESLLNKLSDSEKTYIEDQWNAFKEMGTPEPSDMAEEKNMSGAERETIGNYAESNPPDPAPQGINVSKVESFFVDTAPSKLPKAEFNEPINISVETAEESEEKAWCDKELELREATEETKPDLLDYRFKELMDRQDARDHDAPLETVDEIWLDVHDKLVTLERLSVAQARKLLRERLADLVIAVAGHKGVESQGCRHE